MRVRAPVESRVADVAALVTFKDAVCVFPERFTDWPGTLLAYVVGDYREQWMWYVKCRPAASCYVY